MRLILIGILIAISLCYYTLQALNGGEPGALPETSLNEQPELVPTELPTEQTLIRPTRTPRSRQPTATPSDGNISDASDQRWLVLLYQDADDKILEEDIFIDLNEAERVGSSQQVQIVAQVDRYRGGYQGDGDWTGARRYYVTQDANLNRVESELVEDVGEANMADGETLVDFVTWAVERYPADKYVLVLSDHGMGWPGGWSDPSARGNSGTNAPLAGALGGDHLYLNELDQALEDILARTGIDKFELIGMDACLMGHLEVLSSLAPYANFTVLSQETEPALGWAYSSFLRQLQNEPAMSGGDLSRLIVESYIDDDLRVVDEQARAEFLSKGSPFGGLFGSPSADQLARQLGRDITLTAFDLRQLPSLTQAVNDLAFALQSANQHAIAQARTYAQSFTSIWGRDVQPSYIDLGNFSGLLGREVRQQEVALAADAVREAIERGLIAERHGPGKPGASGVSIYFPNSQLYRNPAAGAQSYTAIAQRFANESLWDDFLAFHYAGREFDLGTRKAAAPAPGEISRAPGAGRITLSQVTPSSRRAAPGQPVLLSVDITGGPLGYIKLFAGFYDRSANSIYVADMDFLESAETRELNGVYYPDWGEGDFTLEFEWEPLVFAINDGKNQAVALLSPQNYGATPEEAVYTIDGIYRYASGEERYARLHFRDGALRQVFGFSGEEAAQPGLNGAPREIIPQPGDTFTILEKWLDLDPASQQVQPASQTGETLTFSNQPFTWQELDAAPGEYVVGYIVEDLDGNAVQGFAQVTVE
jgi:hypothetical protein